MVAEGDELPSVEVMEKSGEVVNVLELFKGKSGILFAVPGAFTPTCSQKHLPGFIEACEELAAAGVDIIACLSVNDPWVMQAWGEQHGADGKIHMLADIKCEFTKAMGMELDVLDKLGSIRSGRYAVVVRDGKIARLLTGDASFAPEVLIALRDLISKL
eukprot:TRINITY_DN9764_c0_g2_i1.p1 TRINITY_DN9764_c0_g2~~TRINITY_DN9764_c0_g2_i1.p1  ORF type:complete len:179 (-),score=25.28 TRINITY_DN9764_c0_g2_i1:91-567(-)